MEFLVGYLTAFGLLILPPVILCLFLVFRSPFSYPYFTFEFDITGKRSPQIEDLLDEFILTGGFGSVQYHQQKIEQWKQTAAQQAERSFLKKYRKRQYEQSIDDNRAFVFHLVRYQTRYMQRNYVRSSYKVKAKTESYWYNYEYLLHRYRNLESIGFECTLKKYHSKKQRNLMTRELRQKIMRRDNYTCQMCGKYMPDEVGLQVDHIVPISKGGRTVASNLRVLCSKCNGSKHDKMPI